MERQKRSGEGGRMGGDCLQCRIFWREACRLRTEPDFVREVAYSDRRLPGFDDVVTYYRVEATSDSAETIGADCYQVKFNMRGSSPIRGTDLVDPQVVNRKGKALLDDLQAVYNKGSKDQVTHRCTLCSTWSPDPDDVLDKAWSRTDGRLDPTVLMAGGPRSAAGKLRRAWREHLGLQSDEALMDLVGHFRIEVVNDLQYVKGLLGERLAAAGLSPITPGTRALAYDDLCGKLILEGKHRFDRDELDRVLQAEGLILGPPAPARGCLEAAIASFARGKEELRTIERVECLDDLFDGRAARDLSYWIDRIPRRVEEFVQNIGAVTSGLRLYLTATHASIAFYLGYCLDTKAGVSVTVVQKTSQGLEYWTPTGGGEITTTLPGWSVTEKDIGHGRDVAIALCVSREIEQDVTSYICACGLPVGRLLCCRLPGCPSSSAVESAQHAHALVRGVLQLLGTRTHDERIATLHVFSAVPNGLLFFLGQRARGLGPCQLYEYDFENNTPGGYSPSIRVPCD